MNEEQQLRKNAYNRARYVRLRAENPEAERERARIKARERRKAHGENVRAADRERYKRNREEIRALRAAQYAANVNGVRDKALEYQRVRYLSGSIEFRVRAALAAAKSRAKRRGIEFDLRIDDVGFPTHCAVSGIEFDMTGGERHASIFVPSLDRIDPAKGYVRGNVRFVCHGYNLAKFRSADSDVLKLARALVKAFPE